MKVFLFLLFLINIDVYAQKLTATSVNDSWLVFKQTHQVDTAKKERVINTLFEVKEQLASKEEVILQDENFISYRWQRLQDPLTVELKKLEKGYLWIKDQKQKIILTDEEHEVIVPPLIFWKFDQWWKKNPKELKWSFLFFVPDLGKTFRFSMQRENPDSLTFKLSPESFFVRAVAGVMYMDFNQERQLLRLRNFKPPVKYRKENSDLEERRVEMSVLN